MTRTRSLVGRILSKLDTPYVSRADRPSMLSLLQQRRPETSQLHAMSREGTVFAIVDGIAEGVSSAEWKLWRKTRSGRKEDRVEVTSHLALKVWNNPNPFMTQQEFVEVVEQHFELVGEQWWDIVRNGTPWPSEIWPVRPDRMEPVPDPDEYLSGYIYTGPDGERVPLGKEDVVFIRRPNPVDAYRGLGPVQAVLVDIDSARYSAEWNRNFFINGAEPGGIVEIPESLGDTEFRQLKQRWEEQHRGVANAHRVAILERGKWVERKFSQRDMQFTELREVSSEVIRKAWRYPKPMLGSVDDVNRANAEAGEYVFGRWIVKPRLDRIKAALNKDFLPMFGETARNLEFDYCNVIPEDQEMEAKLLTARANAAKTLRDGGWHEDDVLSAVDLPAMRYAGTAPVTPNPPAGGGE